MSRQFKICPDCRQVSAIEYDDGDIRTLIEDIVGKTHFAHTATNVVCDHVNAFNVDEEAIPYLWMLWDKGYKTLFSCSGHAFFVADGVVEHYLDLDVYFSISLDNVPDEVLKQILDMYPRSKDENNIIDIYVFDINHVLHKCHHVNTIDEAEEKLRKEIEEVTDPIEKENVREMAEEEIKWMRAGIKPRLRVGISPYYRAESANYSHLLKARLALWDAIRTFPELEKEKDKELVTC